VEPGPGDEASTPVEPGDEASTPVESGDAGRPVHRGAAKVGKPRTVRAFATVPGALSMRPPKPRRVPYFAKAAFPRRVFPNARAAVVSAPALRAAVPDEPVSEPAGGQDHRRGFEGVPASGPGGRLVRKKGLALTAVAAAILAGAGYVVWTGAKPPAESAAVGQALSPGGSDEAERTGSAGLADPANSGGLGSLPSGGAATVAAGARPPDDPFASAPAVAVGNPTRLRVGKIGVDTPLETLHLGPDGALQPPAGFEKAGWYADGTVPGDTGPAVIAGHVDSKAGPAVFYRLRELTMGDRIDVARGGATLHFTVTAIRWYPKTEFPTDEVYGPTPDRQLRLITCGGVFDRSLRSYRDNLVVYAVAG
jgi:LPXTG-site transpeptidase (sortase) family protein